MLNKARMLVIILVFSAGMGSGVRARAQGPTRAEGRPGRSLPATDFRLHADDPPPTARYAAYQDETAPSDDSGQTVERETTDRMTYDLAGPYRLRSADPEPFGEVEIKNIVGWSTTKGDDDDFEYEFELEWGFVRNHELIFAVPVELGDGRVEGNGDIELGWHWKLWEERDWRPAFGMRNFVRIPTGVGSSGVDYEWIGLITKSIIPGKFRVNANPFVKSVNGNNEEDARHFLWGGSLGVDYRLSDDLILVGLYRYEAGELEGTRDNHSLEFGADWTISEHQEIAFGVEVGLDGDDQGPALGARISYILDF